MDVRVHKRPAFWIGLISVFAVAAAGHYRGLRSVEYYGDENDWLTRSYFFRLAFFDRDFGHFLWADRDGIDQPHVTDFAIGAGLFAAGQPLPEVPAESRSWLSGIPPYGERLRAARAPCALLGSLVAPMLFAIAGLASGRLIAGLVAGLLYAIHPLALEWQSRAMSDGPTVFTSVTVLLFLQLFFLADRRRDAPRVRTSCLLACAAAGGLAVGTKLTGLMVAGCPPIAIGLAGLRDLASGGEDRRRAGRWAASLALYAATMSACAVAVNPTLYRSPIARVCRMLDHRWATAKLQQEVFPDVALPSPVDRADRLFRALLWTHPELRDEAFSMLHLNLAALGLCWLIAAQLPGGRDPRRWALTLPVLVWTTVVAVVMTPLVLLNWPRYFLLHVTCWELLSGFGVACAADLLGERVGSRMPWRRLVRCDDRAHTESPI
jgi:hypothetical protein